MNRPVLLIACVLLCCVVPVTLANITFHYDEQGADWTGTCQTGKMQSPIALTQSFVDPGLRPFNFSGWQAPSKFDLLNNGHTIQLQNFNSAATLTDPNTGIQYQLVQFHFHSPSEHVWGSGLADLEVHLVHLRVGGSTSNGNDLLVIGIGLQASEFANNQFLNQFWADLTSVNHTVATKPESKTLTLQSALPESQNYLTYVGSLTTPPCTEGVRWYVMESFVLMSDAQVEYLRSALSLLKNPDGQFQFDGNRRMPQPINGRLVRMFSSSDFAMVTQPTSIFTTINQESSAFASILSLLNTLVIICLVYTVRHQFEIPYFGRVFKGLPPPRSTAQGDSGAEQPLERVAVVAEDGQSSQTVTVKN